MIKQCVICGGEFRLTGSKQKACSVKCSRENANNRQRRKRAENPDKQREYTARAYAKNREKILERDREYKRKNRERIREYERQYNAENRERNNVTKRAWCEKNREHVRNLNKSWVVANPEKARDSHKKASDKWREQNPDYNREHYRRNAEKRKEDARQWKAEAVAAYKLVRKLTTDGLPALDADVQHSTAAKSKPRIRVRKYDAEADRRHAAKRTAALKLIRELQSKGMEALL